MECQEFNPLPQHREECKSCAFKYVKTLVNYNLNPFGSSDYESLEKKRSVHSGELKNDYWDAVFNHTGLTSKKCPMCATRPASGGCETGKILMAQALYLDGIKLKHIENLPLILDWIEVIEDRDGNERSSPSEL